MNITDHVDGVECKKSRHKYEMFNDILLEKKHKTQNSLNFWETTEIWPYVLLYGIIGIIFYQFTLKC